VKINKLIYLVLALSFVSSCNMYMPTSNIVTEEKRPSIIFSDQESKALIYVDGIKMGKIRDYSEKALFLESGVHLLKIVDGGNILYNKKVFITGEEIRKINLK